MPSETDPALAALLYEACLDETEWMRALQTVAETFDGVGTLVRDLTGERPTTWASDGVLEGTRAYSSGWWRYDTVVAASARHGFRRPGICWDTDFVAPDVAAKDMFYQEFLRPNGIGGVATTLAAVPGAGLIAINVQRRLGVPPPEAADRERFAAMSRHLARAIGLRMRLVRAEAIQTALGDRLAAFDCAVAVVDREGVVTEVNPSFDRLRTCGLSVRGGRLCVPAARQRAFDAALNGILAGAQHESTPDTFVLQRSGHVLPLLIRMTPLSGKASERLVSRAPAYGALIVVLDPEHRAYPDLHRILRMLGLTDQQARVAMLMAEGHTANSLAAALAVSTETVRTHRKHIYSKLDINGQHDLVALIAKSVVLHE